MTSKIHQIQPQKQNVNVRRHNEIQLQRKLRLASYVPAPRLIKGFRNHPRLVEVPCKSNPTVQTPQAIKD